MDHEDEMAAEADAALAEIAEEENRIAAEKYLAELTTQAQQDGDYDDGYVDEEKWSFACALADAALGNVDMPRCTTGKVSATTPDAKMELRYICPVCNDGKLYDKAYYEPSGIFVFQCEKCKRLFVEADEMPMIDISEIGDWAELIYERNCDRLETANLLLELVKQSQNPGDYGIPTKCWSDDTITYKCTIRELGAQPLDIFLISRETLKDWMYKMHRIGLTLDEPQGSFAIRDEIDALLNGTAEDLLHHPSPEL